VIPLTRPFEDLGQTYIRGKKMPAYKGKLTDDQIKQLVGYIRELGKKKQSRS
jgi:mono/diheme cytochrome c family protein